MNKVTAAIPADAMAAMEARFGLRVAAALHQQTLAQDHDVGERLRVAREMALERARAKRRVVSTRTVSAPAIVGVSPSGVALMGEGPADWWGRLASALPLLVLVLGLLLIEQWQDQAQITAAADVDAALLADDLPPDAYSDPGFAEYLKAAP